MNFKILLLSFFISITFSGLTHALAVDEWTYKEVRGDLKPNPGCIDKEKAIKKVKKRPDSYTGYSRFKKYSHLLCEQEGYGWTLDSVIDEGEVACEECGGDFEGKYRCYMKEVVVKCKQVAR